MKTIELVCQNCQKTFERALKSDTYRRQKKGMKTFCGRSCSTSYRNKHMPRSFYQKNSDRMRTLSGNRRDEFSPFRGFISKCQSRGWVWNVDIEYLKRLWESQDGKCPYTGFQMTLPETTCRSHSSLKQASLDRIDSSKGYIKGNVEFVCLFINLAKNKHSREELMGFINELRLST